MKVFKTAFYEILGIVPGKGFTRNIAALLTLAPTVPDYFIPSYVQASKTGTAEELRKKEDVRGIIIGCVDGIAISILTARETRITLKRLGAFALLCGMINYAAGLVLPPIGEKVGKKVYAKTLKAQKSNNPVNKINTKA